MLEETEASRLSRRQRILYQEFAFPAAVADRNHDPFLSLESAATWITDTGFKLFSRAVAAPETAMDTGLDVDEIPGDQLTAFRLAIVPPLYLAHNFFSLDNAPEWVRLGAFAAYTQSVQVPPSRLPSRSSSRGSRFGSSAASSPPQTRAGSVASSRISHRSSNRRSISVDSARQNHSSHAGSIRRSVSVDSFPDAPPRVPLAVEENDSSRGHSRGRKREKGKQKQASTRIHITREHSVDRIIPITAVPSTWAVPRDDAVYRLDLSASEHLFEKPKNAKNPMTIQRIIKREDQDSWGGGGGGHLQGDTWVVGFSDDLSVKVWCRRVHHHCKGVHVCEFVPDELFADCERYEPDLDAMRDLWHHQLDANEKEAASHGSILLRFYARVHNSKCPKRDCTGHAKLVLLRNRPNQYGKVYFVGCSEWDPSESLEHIYIPIPANLDEQAFKFVMENDGRLPEGTSIADSGTCSLTLHPRRTMKHCRYGHSLNGEVKVAKIVPRDCDCELIIFVPAEVDPAGNPRPEWTEHMAMVALRYYHNHPVHPVTKPSLEDEHRLGNVIAAIGVEGLTVQRLRNHPLTAAECGERLSKASPGFGDSRRVKDFIKDQTALKYPRGMGWEGVVHYMTTTQLLLQPSEQYIHAAMRKGDFSLVVTMHPLIATFIHLPQALCIDYTFKRIEGDMDEWRVAGFIDRYQKRVTFATLYCNRNTREAFFQLFFELFGIVKRLTGSELALRPWRPEANCRVILLDGEVAQAQGFGDFLVHYNDPTISGIHSRDPLALLAYSLKSCNIHFQRNIDKLAKSVSSADIRVLKSFTGLKTQEEIDAWHVFCAEHSDELIQNWYAQKLNNPWYLASMNQLLSKINPDDYSLTPNSTNLVESAHASRNSETSIRLPLLSGCLSTKEPDERMYDELMQVETGAVMSNYRNGLGDRERLSGQRMVSKMRKTAKRNTQIADYEALQLERVAGQAEWEDSLQRERGLKATIASLKGSRRADLKEKEKRLREQVQRELQARRDWRARRGEIDEELSALREGDLRGVRIQGCRPAKGIASTGHLDDTPNDVQDVGGADLDDAPNDIQDVGQADDSMDPFEIDPELAGYLFQAMDEYEQAADMFAEPPLDCTSEPASDYSILERAPPSPSSATDLNLPPFPELQLPNSETAVRASSNTAGKRRREVVELEEPAVDSGRPKRARNPTRKVQGLSYDDN
ncbi:hypothetical protein C8F01DRAFT_1348352 [Mycena amicta]|nr:hypothetical protein C8F01DRAFT_1348352 [Mycena amicta]